MKKLIKIRSIKKWQEFNEYEGEAEIEVDGRRYVGYLALPSEDKWDELYKIKEKFVDLIFLRIRDIEEIEGAKSITQAQGVNYILQGQVLTLNGEICELDCGTKIEVDLDFDESTRKLGIKKGDWIRFEAMLQVRLDD